MELEGACMTTKNDPNLLPSGATVGELTDLIRVARKLRDSMAFAHYAQHGVVPNHAVIQEADRVLSLYCVPTALDTLVKYETVTVKLVEVN
jgi:DNA-directed RNA polymerase subunit H (RpoH/RPB5)